MSRTVPGSAPEEPEEPQILVPASFVGDTAELMTLVAELIDTVPGVCEQVRAFMDARGAEPVPAADWMTVSVIALARQARDILAFEGMAFEPGLDAYRRPPARWPGR